MLLVLLADACTGRIGPIGGRSPLGANGSGSGSVGAETMTPDAGALPESRPIAPLRRLSRAQYNNTVQDLLGNTSKPADKFLSDTLGAFSGSAALARVSPIEVDEYRAAAEQLASDAVQNLAALLPCQPAAMGDEPCARQFIADFGLRVYRRPLGSDESDSLLQTFRDARTEGDFVFGIQAVLTAMLESPYFLYRVDLPPAGAAAGAVVLLDSYAVASRLSYFLWNSMPDTELFARAQAGKLTEPSDVEAEARRMLADARARPAITDFFGQWLLLAGLDNMTKDPTLFPDYSDALRLSMQTETLKFSEYVMFDADARLDTLLLSPKSFVDGALAALYGLPSAQSFTLVDLDPTQRAGILTQASLLTVTAHNDSTSPTRRGKFVRDRLMCQSPPPPPPNVSFKLPPPKPGESARERYAVHVANPSCASCHTLTDPVGFGFENYDAIGKYRSSDGGKAIDASGQVNASNDIDGPFVGVIELSQKLARSEQVRDCMARQWFRYAQGRNEADGDEASVRVALAAFEAKGSDLRELIVATTLADAFRLRVVEVSP